MKTKYKILIAFAALIIIYLIYSLFFQKENVVSVKVKKGKLLSIIYATGNVSADSYATLRIEDGGNAVIVNGVEGEFVNKGDLLLRTDMNLLSLQLKDSESSLEKAKIDLDSKEKELNRNKKLLESKSITVKQYEDTKRDFDFAKVELSSKMLAIDIIREKIKKKEIRAPFTGLLVSVKAKKGDYLASNTECFEILEPSSILISGQVDEQDLGKIELQMESVVSFDAYPKEIFEGKVIRIVPKTDEATKINKVYVKLNSLPKKLNFGMTATINIKTGETPEAITIPQTAILISEDKSFVFVIKNSVLEKREVSIGKTDGKFAEILSNNLNEEDIVVDKPKDSFETGKKVRIK